MILTEKKLKNYKKNLSLSHSAPQIGHGLAWDRTLTAMNIRVSAYSVHCSTYNFGWSTNVEENLLHATPLSKI